MITTQSVTPDNMTIAVLEHGAEWFVVVRDRMTRATVNVWKRGTRREANKLARSLAD